MNEFLSLIFPKLSKNIILSNLWFLKRLPTSEYFPYITLILCSRFRELILSLHNLKSCILLTRLYISTSLNLLVKNISKLQFVSDIFNTYLRNVQYN